MPLRTDPVRLIELGRTLRAAALDPIESVIQVRERVAERHELAAKKKYGGGFMPWPPCPYEVDPDWERKLHDLLGVEWPCAETGEFWQLWEDVLESLRRGGISVGRGAFAGWGDAEPGLTRAVWCVSRHLQPEKVVETGVARGITTRFILEALERNGRGALWSIDLPPFRLDASLAKQIAAAVPERCRDRWTYVRGSSRRRLRNVLSECRTIELFVHDSSHSERNLRFELDQTWAFLAPDGVLVADDVDLNCGLHSFAREHPRQPALICRAEPLQPDPGRQDDTGVFGVVGKRPLERAGPLQV